MAKDQSVLVQMRLRPLTLNRLDHLSILTGETNRTQLIATSLELTHLLVQEIDQGNQVIIEHPNGQKEKLILAQR